MVLPHCRSNTPQLQLQGLHEGPLELAMTLGSEPTSKPIIPANDLAIGTGEQATCLLASARPRATPAQPALGEPDSGQCCLLRLPPTPS